MNVNPTAIKTITTAIEAYNYGRKLSTGLYSICKYL
jgi:hypothetical protein